MIALRAAENASPADWVVAGIRGFGESVLSLVPEGFPAYVRVFHPAHADDRGVTWANIARRNGKVAHAGMQLVALTGLAQGQPQPDVFDVPPLEGSMPPSVSSALAGAVGRHTSTRERCWFAFWEGHGGLTRDVTAAPGFELPNRGYHLLGGPVDAATEPVIDRQSANLWWPDDRAWCVATEIDLNTTYLGCSQECAEAVIARAGIEATAIPPTTGIAFDSDAVN